MKYMRAAYIERFGPAESIRYGRLPVPRPRAHEVLVDVEVTTVNYVDTFVRAGLVRTGVGFPFVVGRDLVGRVAEIGGDAPTFAVGDRVWCNSLGHAYRQGAAAEQVIVPVARLYQLPDGVAADSAVTVLHPAATAFLGLYPHGRLEPGQTVVVVGAAGNVGSAMVTLAAQGGARVIAVARERDAPYCRSLGADVVVDHRAEGYPQRLASACAGGVDLYLDPAGVNDIETAVSLLADRGRIVLLAGLSSTPTLAVGPLYVRDRSIAGFAITNATIEELARAAELVNDLLYRQLLRPRALVRLPLRETAVAHRMQESGELRARRVVLDVGCAGDQCASTS